MRACPVNPFGCKSIDEDEAGIRLSVDCRLKADEVPEESCSVSVGSGGKRFCWTADIRWGVSA